MHVYLIFSVKTLSMIGYCSDEYNYASRTLAGLLGGPVS